MSAVDWNQAKCKGMGEMFFSPVLDARTEENREIRETACKAICFTCPLRLPCLEIAICQGEDLGVWGGMSEGERARFSAMLPETPWIKNPGAANFRRAVTKFYERELEHYETIGFFKVAT